MKTIVVVDESIDGILQNLPSTSNINVFICGCNSTEPLFGAKATAATKTQVETESSPKSGIGTKARIDSIIMMGLQICLGIISVYNLWKLRYK